MGKGNIGDMKKAEEGSSIERQWNEVVGSKPCEALPPMATLSGNKVAQRSNARNPSAPPGGEGNGRNPRPMSRGKGPKL